MRDPTPQRADTTGTSREHSSVWKERLDNWLDDALEDTFPASDPVASPPEERGRDVVSPDRPTVPVRIPRSTTARRSRG